MAKDSHSVREFTTGIRFDDRDRRPATSGNAGQPRTLVLSEVRLYRDAFQRDLLASGAVEVVGVARSDDITDQLGRLRPTILVMDAMTGLCSFELAWWLKELKPDLRIVVVVSGRDETELLRLAEVGVDGFVDRNGSAADLVTAVLHAARGEMLCSPRVVALLTKRIAILSAERKTVSPIDSLTPREREVLALVAQGLSNKHIAQQLDIADTTTRNHVHSILDKLGLKNRLAAGAFYSQTGCRLIAPKKARSPDATSSYA